MKFFKQVPWYFAVSLSIMFPLHARAESSGNDLLQQCNAAVRVQDGDDLRRPEDVTGAMFCLGLVQGVTNTNRIYQVVAKDKALFCAPETAKNGQGARIVVKYLNDHPEDLHMNDTFLVVMALRGAFPCPQP